MAYVNLPWELFSHFLRICGSSSSPVLGYVMLLNLCLNRNALSNVCGSDGKESTCNAGDPGSIPGSRRSPGEGNGNPLQSSCLENPKDRGAWWATVHGVLKSQTTEHRDLDLLRNVLGVSKETAPTGWIDRYEDIFHRKWLT